MALFWPDIGQDATFAPTLDAHNSANFHPILTFDTTKMTNSARRIAWRKKLSSISFGLDFSFLHHFCSEASHGQYCAQGPKTTLKMSVHVLAFPFNSLFKIMFEKNITCKLLDLKLPIYSCLKILDLFDCGL